MIAQCSCGGSFDIEIPKPDIVNGQVISVFVLRHPERGKCPQCGAEYVIALAIGQELSIDLIEMPRKKEIIERPLVIVPN